MRKLFAALVLSILLLTGCGPHWQVTKPEFKDGQVVQDGQVVKLEQLTEKSGANVVRAFTALIGGGTGSLDKISRTTITNGDIAMVVTGNIIYFYQYNSPNNTAEVSPTYIRPNDWANDPVGQGSGVWYLVDVRAKGVNTGSSTLPSIDFYDSDATDGDLNARIQVNCTTAGSGAENCVMYFQTQVAGSAVATRALIDETGSFNAPLVPIIKNGDGANSLTAAQCQGQLVLLGHDNAISDLTLPDYTAAVAADKAAIGSYVCVMAASAYAHTIHPAADDKIRTSNLTLNAAGAGVTYTTASTPIGGYVCFVLSDAATNVGHWTQFGMNGTWPIH